MRKRKANPSSGKVVNKGQSTNNQLQLKVLGVLEKRWGQLMCGHGHEGSASFVKLPNFPQR
jgi:hypothetical protein